MKRLVVALALFISLPAAADRAPDLGAENPKTIDYQSPQHFAFEIKFGPYSPNIDSTPGLTGKPFSELFQNQFGSKVGQRPSGALLSSIEFDWQFWHKFGSFALAASVGFSRRTTHSFEYNQTGDELQSCTIPNCTRSGDETALNVMPFALELVYRFDVLALRYRVPLVPYFKGGLAYYLWWMQDGSGNLSTDVNNPSDKAIGGSFGLVLHPGIALMLDVIDKTAARIIDAEIGINHSYIFFEMNYAWITNFNIGDKMVFSDLTWNGGLAFEF